MCDAYLIVLLYDVYLYVLMCDAYLIVRYNACISSGANLPRDVDTCIVEVKCNTI